VHELIVESSKEENASKSYAQSCMQQLAQAMLHKLPRELRDYIYALLWEPFLEKSRRELDQASHDFTLDRQNHRIKLPVFSLAEYTGPAVADEALSHLYRETFQKRPCYFDDIEPTTFCGYLFAEPFARGFQPITWVREMNINWNNRLEEEVIDDVIAGFNSLWELDFPSPVTVTIELTSEVLTRRSVGKRGIDQLMLFQPTFEVLVRKGHTVIISYEGEESDLIGFYTRPRKAWLEEMQEAHEDWKKRMDGGRTFRIRMMMAIR
jgi:hypothetical protein